MWIFTNYGFFSFTQSTFRRGFIQIRARDDRDLTDLKAKHGLKGKIIETQYSDYRWRILCRQTTAARILASEAMDIDYSNFKDSTTARQHGRPLMEIWSAMMRVQRERATGAPEPRPGSRSDRSRDYERQCDLFSDGTIDEDSMEEEEWRQRRTTGPAPRPFEPSYEEAAEFNDNDRDDDYREPRDSQPERNRIAGWQY